MNLNVNINMVQCSQKRQQAIFKQNTSTIAWNSSLMNSKFTESTRFAFQVFQYQNLINDDKFIHHYYYYYDT